MAKVTSKLQITIPKRFASRFGISPGDEVTWEDGGEVIRIRPASATTEQSATPEQRLELFDQATRRQAERDRNRSIESLDDRGWTREELYDRAGPR